MLSVSLFAEDYGHETVVTTLVTRLAREACVEVELHAVSVRGGHGKVEVELGEYVHSVQNFSQPLPDIVIIATDANCDEIQKRRQRLGQIAQPLADRVIYAIPNPHVERWLLLDAAAFRAVLGAPCQAPDEKCDRGRYKRLLIDAVRDAKRVPLLGGMEHAVDIMENVRIPKGSPKNEFEQFACDVRAALRRLARPEDSR